MKYASAGHVPKGDAAYLTQAYAERTYAEVAEALGMTVARVGQLERAALLRMRRCLDLIEGGLDVDAAIIACRGKPGRPRKVSAG